MRIVALLLALALLPASASAATVDRAPPGGWTVGVSYPAALDATLARVTFANGVRLRASVGETGTFGHVTVGSIGRMYGLVLVVNRRPINAPSIQIADPTSIPVTFRDIQPLHRPRVAERVGLLANAASPAAGPLCGRRAPLFVRADTGAGFAYPAREALVQALNAACGRPVDPAFVAAVQQEPPPPPPCPPCRPQAGRVCPDAVSAPAIACVQP